MISLYKQSQIALIYFVFIALLGVFLRLFHVVDMEFDYRHLVHTHSHIALLGWVYTAFSILIYKLFLQKASIEKKYNRLFWFTQLTVVGMLITFPFTGYALFSILSSSLFIIASYILAYLVFKFTPNQQKTTYAYKCIRMALWYMILSSIGPWSLGGIMATLGSTSDLYRNAIYFYLHFQYNGWFIMGIFALLFYYLEQKNIQLPKKVFSRFFTLMNLGILTTFGISLLWMQPSLWVYILSGIGALAQLIAVGVLLKSISSFKLNFGLFTKAIILFYGIKLLMQIMGTLPYFADQIAINTDFIIGYIHWIFLGVISPALLLFLKRYNIVSLSKNGMYLYFIGFLFTEGLIFYKGTSLWLGYTVVEFYFESLVLVSVILAVSILLIFKQTKKQLI